MKISITGVTLCCLLALSSSCVTFIAWDKPPMEEALRSKRYTTDQAKKAYSFLRLDRTYVNVIQTEDLAGSDRYYSREDVTSPILDLLPSAQTKIDEAELWQNRYNIASYVSDAGIYSVIGGIVAGASAVVTGGGILFFGSWVSVLYFENQKNDAFDSAVQDYNNELDRRLRDWKSKQPEA